MNINIKDLSKEQREDLLKQLQDYKEQPSWDELLDREYVGCFFLDDRGDIIKFGFTPKERAHNYQDETFAKARKWQEEARKVAMSFEGYKEIGIGYAVVIYNSLGYVKFDTKNEYLLNSVAVFESKEVANDFIQFCKDSGKIDDNNKIVLE